MVLVFELFVKAINLFISVMHSLLFQYIDSFVLKSGNTHITNSNFFLSENDRYFEEPQPSKAGLNGFSSMGKHLEDSIALNTTGATCKSENNWDTIAMLKLAQMSII